MEEHPFLLRKSLLCSAYEEDLSIEIERGLLTDMGIGKLNSMAREALKGSKQDNALLARAALLFHRRFSSYLENFEIDQDYYLHLAEKFARKVDGEEGDYLLYLIERERGNFKRALKLVDALIRKYGDGYKIHKARLLMDMGDRDAAFLIYEEILRDNRSAWKNLADALLDLGEYGDASKIYAKVVEEDPNSVEAMYNLALSLFKLKRYHEASEILKKVVKRDKYNFDAYLLLLNIYDEEGLEDERKALIAKLKRLGFPGEVLQ